MKLFKSYEYWPSYLFYIPILPYAVYLAIKAKSGGFFYATNPALDNSGDGTESKYKTILLIPPEYRPNTVFVAANSDLDKILTNITTQSIYYPLIIKPDIGFRGLLVKKINNKKELVHYLKKYNSIHLIIQEFISYPNECGILYFKIPGLKKGNISSLTFKKFISVKGDGTSNISELIQNDDRAKKYYSLLKESNESRFNAIPINGKVIQLGDIGNHSKGTEFINANQYISKTLTKTFDKINAQIDGWNYGRIDIKYNSFKELENGKAFKILEINGLISEPTHIYDASKGSYLNSLKEICKHWNIIYKISTCNITQHEIQSKNLKHFIKSLQQLQRYILKIKNLSL